MKILLFENFTQQKNNDIALLLTDIIVTQAKESVFKLDDKGHRVPSSEISYDLKTLFARYKKNPILAEFYTKLCDSILDGKPSPRILFSPEQRRSYNHQSSRGSYKGAYNPDDRCIYLDLSILSRNYADSYHIDRKKESAFFSHLSGTISHEIFHMIEDLFEPGSYDYDQEYSNRIGEKNASISQFISSYSQWDKSIEEIIHDFKLYASSNQILHDKGLDDYAVRDMLIQAKSTKQEYSGSFAAKTFKPKKPLSLKIEDFLNGFDYDYNKSKKLITIDDKGILDDVSFDENSGQITHPTVQNIINFIASNKLSIITRDATIANIAHETNHKLNINSLSWSIKNYLHLGFLISFSTEVPKGYKIGLNFDANVDKRFSPNISTLRMRPKSMADIKDICLKLSYVNESNLDIYVKRLLSMCMDDNVKDIVVNIAEIKKYKDVLNDNLSVLVFKKDVKGVKKQMFVINPEKATMLQYTTDSFLLSKKERAELEKKVTYGYAFRHGITEFKVVNGQALRLKLETSKK